MTVGFGEASKRKMKHQKPQALSPYDGVALWTFVHRPLLVPTVYIQTHTPSNVAQITVQTA